MWVLAAFLGNTIGLDTAGHFIPSGCSTSDNGIFNESVSSTEIYCNDITVYNNATVNNRLKVNSNIGCNGDFHCGLGTVFCGTADCDYCIVTASLRTNNLESFNGLYLLW